MTPRSLLIAPPSQVVLSLFPGIDLLGWGFEAEGLCVVRGPDRIFCGDVGSPCQDFSRARRDPPTGEGQEMLGEFRRVVSEAAPDWWLLENVPGAPSIEVEGYSHQRIDIDARDLGLGQRRLRHFQFGHRAGLLLALPRPSLRGAGQATCMASESNKAGRRNFAEFCALQGLPRSFDLPGLTLAAKYRAVGNGVHIEVARFVARAVARPGLPDKARLCACGCAHPVTGKARAAGQSCRKRLQRKGDAVVNGRAHAGRENVTH